MAADGSVYVTGLFAPHGTQAGDVPLLKFFPAGSLIWQRAWDSGNTEAGEAVAVASDGSIYVSGGSNALVSLGPLVLLRFAPDGTLFCSGHGRAAPPGTRSCSAPTATSTSPESPRDPTGVSISTWFC